MYNSMGCTLAVKQPIIIIIVVVSTIVQAALPQLEGSSTVAPT